MGSILARSIGSLSRIPARTTSLRTFSATLSERKTPRPSVFGVFPSYAPDGTLDGPPVSRVTNQLSIPSMHLCSIQDLSKLFLNPSIYSEDIASVKRLLDKFNVDSSIVATKPNLLTGSINLTINLYRRGDLPDIQPVPISDGSMLPNQSISFLRMTLSPNSILNRYKVGLITVSENYERQGYAGLTQLVSAVLARELGCDYKIEGTQTVEGKRAFGNLPWQVSAIIPRLIDSLSKKPTSSGEQPLPGPTAKSTPDFCANGSTNMSGP